MPGNFERNLKSVFEFLMDCGELINRGDSFNEFGASFFPNAREFIFPNM